MPSAVAIIFNCDPSDSIAVLRGYLNIVSLVDEVERLVRTIPTINPAKHLAWTSKVRAHFSRISLSDQYQMSHLIGAFDDSAMALLSICSDHLERHCAEPVADQAGVSRLLTEAIQLFREISKSELSPPIREYMLRHLQIVIDALFDYRTKGFEALWNGLSSSQGHNNLAALRIGLAEAEVRASPYWPKIVATVAGLCALIDGAQRIDFVLEKKDQVSRIVSDLLPAGQVKEQMVLPCGPASSESASSR